MNLHLEPIEETPEGTLYRVDYVTPEGTLPVGEWFIAGLAPVTRPEPVPAPQPEFMGFGKDTVGGEGGDRLTVTELGDDGLYSLRWALEQDTPRVVDFAVSGIIDLDSEIKVGPNVTIIGGSVMGPVTVRGARLKIVGSEVIMRGMRIRPGDGPGQNKDSRDCLSIGSDDGSMIENIVIDGNSFTWSTDELLTVYRGARNVSITNNIIAEALRNAGHSKGDHSMGVMVGGSSRGLPCERVTIARNLIASAEFRAPRIKDGSDQIEVINNLVYNYGSGAFQTGDGSERIHFIGNHYIPGLDSGGSVPIRPGTGRNLFMDDNIGRDNGIDGENKRLFEGSGIEEGFVDNVEHYVLSSAGARPLDPIDQRILKLDGRWIDSPDEVGGYV